MSITAKQTIIEIDCALGDSGYELRRAAKLAAGVEDRELRAKLRKANEALKEAQAHVTRGLEGRGL